MNSPDPRIVLSIDGTTAWLRIDRPAKRNAIDQAMWEAVPRQVETALATAGVRALILTSATPGLFCAGADIAEFAARAPDAGWRAANQAAIRAAQLAIARAAIPTIAAIDGDCVGGGCGLAIACDIRIAAPAARLGITPARLGLVYSLHDTKLLVDLVGPAHAKGMLFTGRLLGAEHALAIGLINEMAADPVAAADLLAQEIAAAAPSSQRAIKAIVRRILDGATDDDDASAAMFDGAFTGADFAEGVAAFLGRRKPDFRG